MQEKRVLEQFRSQFGKQLSALLDDPNAWPGWQTLTLDEAIPLLTSDVAELARAVHDVDEPTWDANIVYACARVVTMCAVIAALTQAIVADEADTTEADAS